MVKYVTIDSPIHCLGHLSNLLEFANLYLLLGCEILPLCSSGLRREIIEADYSLPIALDEAIQLGTLLVFAWRRHRRLLLCLRLLLRGHPNHVASKVSGSAGNDLLDRGGLLQVVQRLRRHEKLLLLLLHLHIVALLDLYVENALAIELLVR